MPAKLIQNRIRTFRGIFLIFCVSVRFLHVRSEDEFTCLPHLQTIQSEMLARMASYVQASWNHTASHDQNFHVFPIMNKIGHTVIKMRLYHNSYASGYVSQNVVLKKQYAFAEILAKLRNSSNVQLRFPNALFYDRRYTTWRMREDLETHLLSELYEIPFERENEQKLLTLINDWMSRNMRGDYKKRTSIRLETLTNFHDAVLKFTSCWDTTKTFTNFTKLRYRRRRRFINVPSPQFFSFNVENLPEEIDVNSFSAKETIGYYNNAQQKYEAIKIPLNNEEYAMIVVLPYDEERNSLDFLQNFTGPDYQQLLQRVNEQNADVHYTIPIFNSSAFVINEQGVNINGGKLCDYTASRVEDFNRSRLIHKPFFVDRPFASLIYHERTGFVVMLAIMRNPFSNSWPKSSFKIHITSDGDDEAVEYVSP